MKNLQKKTIVLIIALLALLVVFGLYFGVTQFISNNGSTSLVNVPPINTRLTSSKDGKTHSIDAAFTIEATKFKNKKIDANALQDKIRAIVSELDYEKIAAIDGTKYIKEEIAKNLSDFIEPEDLEGVYITDVVSDAKLEADTDVPVDRRSDVFKGLFKNAK